jgi:hypothetical protein
MRASKLRTALPAVAMAAGLALSAGNAWAATPSASANKTTKLKDGKVITVKWKGFKKPTATKGNQYLAIVQCTAAVIADEDQAHCDLTHPTVIGDGETKAPAKGTATYAVATGAIGTLGESCGTTATNKDDCVIIVTGLDDAFAPISGQAANIPITFK